MDKFKLDELYQNLDSYITSSLNEAKSTETNASNLLNAFLADYGSEAQIMNMTLEQYCVGHRPNESVNRSTYCYRVEYELKSLGTIGGANSQKFGIFMSNDTGYYTDEKGRTSKDSAQLINNEFQTIKENIITISRSDMTMSDFNQITLLDDCYKNKLLYLYHANEQKIPIHDRDNLFRILAYFEVSTTRNDTISDLRLKLYGFYLDNIKYNPKYSEITPFIFVGFLYHNYSSVLESGAKRGQKTKSSVNLKTKSKIVNTIDLDDEYEEDEKEQTAINKVLSYDANSVEFLNQCNRTPELADNQSNKARYRTNSRMAKTAIETANYICEADSNHVTFESKHSTQYVEAHHLIPMHAQKDFYPLNLDRVENIVALCPTCHAKIHRGSEKERREILKKLYDLRIDSLKKVGLDISFDELFDKYYK